MKIGFIGQGWIGKNLADNFESRGYEIVRFAKEEPHNQNEAAIKECDIVFIAVPTPTTPTGFDDSIVRSVMKYIGTGKTAVIKSTILPGTTESIQKEYPEIHVFHAPEFLKESTARQDTDFPDRNIVGIPVDNVETRALAQQVIDVLPTAPFTLICSAKEAELIKYAGNCFLYSKVIFMNLLFDLTQKLGCDYENIKIGMGADPRIGKTHMDIIHKSGNSDTGRGAGGHCFIKDFAALVKLYEGQNPSDLAGIGVLKALEAKNIQLLKNSKKDLDLLAGVYGEQ